MGNIISIQKPEKSELLAELVGILLGDGGITKYQVAITLHSHDDKAYGEFVVSVIQNLFKITPALYQKKKYAAFDIVISRREMVRFCTEELGLVTGNKVKQGIDVPNWIRDDQNFRIACLRGLVDTDGSVFFHKYRVNGKMYRYKKLDFTSLSRPLCVSVLKIFRDIGIKARFARGKSIRIDSKSEMENYFRIVGSHNPKHLNRYFN